MAIDLNGNVHGQLATHVGHNIVCSSYGDGINIALECETCGSVLLDADRPDVARKVSSTGDKLQ